MRPVCAMPDTYQLRHKRYGLPPWSNVGHAVDVAVERVVTKPARARTHHESHDHVELVQCRGRLMSPSVPVPPYLPIVPSTVDRPIALLPGESTSVAGSKGRGKENALVTHATHNGWRIHTQVAKGFAR